MIAALRPWGTVFALAAMFGFVVTALGGGVIEERAVFGAHETAAARTYMISLLESRPQTLIALTPRSDVVNRAMQFAQSEEAIGQISTSSLTYLGGRTSGQLSVHVYAVELRAADGRRQFFPLAITMLEGKVVRSE